MPKKLVYPKDMPEEEKAAHLEENLTKKPGLLQEVKFYRIILDEGHTIRNHKTQKSQAAFHLQAHHRWILSGTPLLNGSSDAYSYAYFIRHPLVYPKMTLKAWKKRFSPQEDDEQPAPLPDTLMKCIHRFTHADELLGARIVTLPPMHHDILETEFLPFEKVVDRILDRNFKSSTTSSNKDGEEFSSSVKFLALLTMKRQLSSHPLILSTEICNILEPTDFEKLDGGLKEQEQRGHKGNDYIRRLYEQLQAGHTSDLALKDSTTPDLTESLFSKSLDPDEVHEVSDQRQRKGERKNVKTGGSHGKHVEYNSFLDSISKTKSPHIHNQRTQCVVCGRPADQARKALPCNHVYCKTHLKDMMHEQNSANPVCKSPGCGEVIQSNRSADMTDASFHKWQNGNGEVYHSAKTLAVNSQILKFWEEDPKAKVLVFTVWRGMLEILSNIFHSQGWVHTTLHGGLDQKVREDNIANFKSDPKVKILIATLFTGGTGLNLTCASKAILCEPWWHSGAEDQAFGRLYR
jgi:SNF2 family DNA or RNA helicase